MMYPDLEASIRRRAHEIWVEEGKPEGRARIHWLRAEAEFREKIYARESLSSSARSWPRPSIAPPASPGAYLTKHV